MKMKQSIDENSNIQGGFEISKITLLSVVCPVRSVYALFRKLSRK